MQVALAMLGRRALSAAGVRERIAGEFGTAEAERVVERLLGLGVLDDRKYAEAFVRDRFVRAGYGRVRIRADLLARGVAPQDADAAIAAIIERDGERERAVRALERFRRARQGREPVHDEDTPCDGAGGMQHSRPAPGASVRAVRDARRKLRDAAFRHLIGRGFAFDLAREVIERFLEEGNGASPRRS